ncbi:sigma-E processing peptidase SpoIIGA [Clostridium sp.]|uniref:sigma-E processing peptidase SpoIIGA n=1 Tax=Clostridium sp. TaxID=1506 RepID=UPI002FCC55CB
MGYEVYIDVLILQNLAMNFFLIYLLKRLCKIDTKAYKMLIASFIGALYVFVIFFDQLHILYTLAFKVLVSILMIYIAFTPKTKKLFLKYVFVFYTIAFLLGGGIIGIFYMIFGDINSLDSGYMLSRMSPGFVIVGSIITTIFVKIGFDVFETYYKENYMAVELEVFINGKSCIIKGFIDTGNYLVDQSGSKVIVSDFNALKEILPIKEEGDLAYSEISKIFEEEGLKSRLRLIPYSAIGTSGGSLTGVKTDMIVAKGKDKVKVNKGITIAFHNKAFLGEGNFDALAFPEILI